MGTGNARLEDSLVGFSASLSAGDFFSDLEVKQKSDGLSFTKNSRVVKTFPEKMTVEISTFVLKSDGSSPESPEVAMAILQALRFDVEWKTGLKTRSVDSYRASLRQPSVDEWEQSEGTKALARIGLTFPREASWVFDLAIDGRGVPLTDSLLVTVSSREGRRIARFSARL